MSETREAPTLGEMPESVRWHIPQFKYQHFDPYVLSSGTIEHHIRKAEEIVEWWPGWIHYCLQWCDLVIAAAERGEYHRPDATVPFPMEAWKAQRDVFKQAMDDGKFIAEPPAT